MKQNEDMDDYVCVYGRLLYYSICDLDWLDSFRVLFSLLFSLEGRVFFGSHLLVSDCVTDSDNAI